MTTTDPTAPLHRDVSYDVTVAVSLPGRPALHHALVVARHVGRSAWIATHPDLGTGPTELTSRRAVNALLDARGYAPQRDVFWLG